MEFMLNESVSLKMQELRVVDYMAGRKTSSIGAAPGASLFSQQHQTGMFGSALNKPNTSNLFSGYIYFNLKISVQLVD